MKRTGQTIALNRQRIHAMINLTDDSRMPITAPIELEEDHLARYLEIRMLRMLFDQSGHRPVGWNADGQVVPGQWKMRPHKNQMEGRPKR